MNEDSSCLTQTYNTNQAGIRVEDAVRVLCCLYSWEGTDIYVNDWEYFCNNFYSV